MKIKGATFAYFSVTANNLTETTVVTGKTDSVGSVSFAVAETLPSISLSAADMAEAVSNTAAKTYWATSLGSSHVDSQEWTNVLNASVTGGLETTKYNCTATLQVSIVDGDEGTKPTEFTENDKAILHLDLVPEADENNTISVKDFNLKDIETTNTTEVTFQITGAKTSSSALDVVKASFQIDNASQQPQANLVDKAFKIQIATTAFSCDPVA